MPITDSQQIKIQTMRAIAGKQREEDRTKAILISVVLHAIVLALLFFTQVMVEKPVLENSPIVIDWGGGGDNAAPGTPDAGQGNNPAPQGQQMDDPSSKTPVAEPEPTPPKKTTAPPKTSAPTPVKTQTSSDPDVAAIRRQQEETKRKEAEAAERERQRIAAEQEQARKAQEERDKKKGAFGSTFGKPGSTGTGQGNTGKPGNQGIPGGTGTNPFGKENGSGGGTGGGDGTGVGESIGGGLSGRRVVGRPKMVDDTQNTGRVAVRVCVAADGSVTSANYTLTGSTTNDGVLRSKAESWARQYRFAPSDTAEQCGTVTFDFRVK